MKDEVISWLKEGCNIIKGVALYNKYGNNFRFKLLLKCNPEAHAAKLKLLLCRLSGVKSVNYSGAIRESERDKFREMYPFLSDYNCPRELKMLAADKITTYWNIVELHEKLFSCHKNSDCLKVAKELVETFIEDQEIKRELNHYKQNGGVLGTHRVFEDNKRIDRIREMNVRELIRKEKQLRDNIWRIKSEITKGNKPYLQHERETRLLEKEKELQIVLKMLDE